MTSSGERSLILSVDFSAFGRGPGPADLTRSAQEPLKDAGKISCDCNPLTFSVCSQSPVAFGVIFLQSQYFVAQHWN